MVHVYARAAAALLGSHIVYTIFCFIRNLRIAQQSGLPYTWSPVHEMAGLTWVTDRLLRWLYRERLLEGKGWPRWVRFMVKDWQYEDRRRAALEYGDTFLVVTPLGLVCYISNPTLATKMTMRRKVFIKPENKMKILEPFGPNVVTVEGDVWKFHLGITLPPLAAESVARLVWDETARQVDIMAASWQPADSHKKRIYTLTMNTISFVGFGRQAEWDEEHNAATLPTGHKLTLTGALMGTVMHLPHIMLLPRWLLRWSPWPIAYEAIDETERYVEELLNDERQKLESGGTDDNINADRENLLTAVLRTNLAATKKDAQAVGRASLTNEEIKGNVFVFLLAGYDTTANTTMYATYVLTLYKNIQDRVIEEIDDVYAQAAKEGRSELSYTVDFPRFRYLVAFMYEVMRVFPIAHNLARVAAAEHDVAGCVLPRGTTYIVNNTAIHYDPELWPSPDTVEPRRWMVSDPHTLDPVSGPTPTQEAEIRSGRTQTGETIPIPSNRKGTFLSFGEGPRACLGRNFARVEFVSTIIHLLRRHRLEMLDESPNAAARFEHITRLLGGGSPIALTPPEDARVRLVTRK